MHALRYLLTDISVLGYVSLIAREITTTTASYARSMRINEHKDLYSQLYMSLFHYTNRSQIIVLKFKTTISH